jgi:hypothetical protein
MANRKAYIWVALAIALSFLTHASFKLPFIPSEQYLHLLMFLVYPLSVIGSFAFIFFHSSKQHKKTGWQLRMERCHSKWQRIKIGSLTLLGGPVLLAGIVAFSQFYPAWFTQHWYQQISDIEAEVTYLGYFRKGDRRKIKLQDIISNREFELRWKTDHLPLKEGDLLKLHTKQNWFGNYVTDFKITSP